MTYLPAQRRGIRELRRAIGARQAQARRWQRRRRQGQSLVIFALTLTVLLGLAGLSIDVARAYDLYARMQRAAESGALAGVLYMPSYYATQRPGDTESGISRTSKEVAKNGFGNALPVTTTAAQACATTNEISICAVTGKNTDLRVTITERLTLVLLGGLGVTPITLQAAAQSEYLSPIQIGARSNGFGNIVECPPNGSSDNTRGSYCDPSDTSRVHLQSFLATFNGPAELKESGDPFVYCAAGPADITNGSGTPSTNPLQTNSIYTYNGYPTNHQQQPGQPAGTTNTVQPISSYCGKPVVGGKKGNPDYQPEGYFGPATQGIADHQGGYNYNFSIGPDVAAASLWIYNPSYIPQDNAALAPLDRFVDSNSQNFYQGPNGEGIGLRFDGTHHDAPLFFFTVTLSVYRVSNLYDHSTDTLAYKHTYAPYDATSADLSTHGCATNGSQVYNPIWNGADTANTYHNAGSIVFGGGCIARPGCQALNASGQQDRWCLLTNGTNEVTCPGGACADATAYPFATNSVYRVVLEATGLQAVAANRLDPRDYDYASSLTTGWGSHGYALKGCDSLTVISPYGTDGCRDGTPALGAGGFNKPEVTLYGWNNMDVIFQTPLSSQSPNPNYPATSCISSNATPYACLDVGCIPTEYAGRSVTLSVFDPGDASGGDLYLGIAPPSGSGATAAIGSNYAGATLATIDGQQSVQTYFNSNGYRPFNGLWINTTLSMPSTYQGDCQSSTSSSGKSGWWQIMYARANGSQPTDKLAVKFTLVGSPVHLVPIL